MSLLADLLSKRNNAEPSSGKDIPPTLSEAHGIPVKVRSLKNRYVVVSVLCLALVAVGLLAMTQFGRISGLLSGKPVPVTQLIKPPVVAPPVASPAKVPEVVPEPPQIVEVKKPATEAAVKAAVKKTSAQPKRARHKAFTKAQAPPKLAAVIPTVRAVPPTAPPAATPLAGKIDTAKRDAYLYAARSAEQVSDWRTALANYRKAQKIDPDNYIIMNNSAAALNNLAMFDEGAKEAKRALNKKADYVPAMVNAAIAYSSKGNSQEALRLFSEAALADPGNRSLVINLGILQERTGKLDQAQATYRPLAEEGDPLALQGMGRIYERRGNRLEAVRVYRQIMTLPNAAPGLKKEVKSSLVRLEE